MRVPVLLPDLGPGPVRLSAWFVDEGEMVFEGDRLVEVLLDAATFDVSAPADGMLESRVAEPGQLLAPGQVLGMIAVSDAEEGSALS